MTKNELRSIIRDRLKNLSLKDKLEYDKCIERKVCCNKYIYGNVLLYNSLKSEVDTKNIIEYALKNAKNVYLPKVFGNDIQVIKIDNNTQYEVGDFNIVEPIGESIDLDDLKLDVSITPLLGFDDNNNRLGKGKGYYDRFFEKVSCKKIGLAYSVQKVDNIDVDKFDIKLDEIITN